jgi:hypothetical protein
VGENWSSESMAVTAIVRTPDVTIELDDRTPIPTAHRLSELVQVLSGCSVERAELAVSDPTPEGPIPAEDALDVVATALVRLRARSNA